MTFVCETCETSYEENPNPDWVSGCPECGSFDGESWLQDRDGVMREIAGALKSSIAAHGPITPYKTRSAAKRVYAALLHRRRMYQEGELH